MSEKQKWGMLGDWFYVFGIGNEVVAVESAPGFSSRPEPKPFKSFTRRMGKGRTPLAAVRNSHHVEFFAKGFWQACAQLELDPGRLHSKFFDPVSE